MKRLMGILIALLLLAFAATPAFADGPGAGDHVCFGGRTVVPANDVVDSVVLFGCGARIQSGAQVQKDIVSFGGNVVVEQGVRVDGDVVVFGGNLDIAGEVRRDVTVFGSVLTLQSTAVVSRDVALIGGILDQKEGAVIRGRVTRSDRFYVAPFRFGDWEPSLIPTAIGGGLVGAMAGIAVGFVRSIIYALALAALGALTVVFLPAQTKQVSDTAEKSTLPSLGVGCLTLLAAFPLFILLIILIITIPAALLLPVALIVAWLFGWIALGRLVGEKVMEALKARESLNVPIVAVVVGIILLAIVGAVPFVGWLISLVVGLIAIGAVVLTRFGTRPYPPLTPAPVAIAPAAPVTPAALATPSASTAPSTLAAPSESAPTQQGDTNVSI